MWKLLANTIAQRFMKLSTLTHTHTHTDTASALTVITQLQRAPRLKTLVNKSIWECLPCKAVSICVCVHADTSLSWSIKALTKSCARPHCWKCVIGRIAKGRHTQIHFIDPRHLPYSALGEHTHRLSKGFHWLYSHSVAISGNLSSNQ